MSHSLIKGFDARRLRRLLIAFFLVLAIPTTALIWQAYSQLKWESFHQLQTSADELSARIDRQLASAVAAADARSFADYGFLVVTGEPSANFLQQSPLSAYPVTGDVPGTIGYFQVRADGSFSTPLLPPAGTITQKFGISPEDMARRGRLAGEIQRILADNQLLNTRPEPERRRDLALLPQSPAGLEKAVAETVEEAISGRAAERDDEAAPDHGVGTARTPAAAIVTSGSGAESDSPAASAFLADEAEPAGRKNDKDEYSQRAFDELSAQRQNLPAEAVSGGKLLLQEREKKKSEVLEDSRMNETSALQSAADTSGKRYSRKEQIALPEAGSAAPALAFANVADVGNLRISTFESEVDPLDFSLLDSGHLVLFRKVWREDERYIQGILLDQEDFLASAIDQYHRGTTLDDFTNLLVLYQGKVLRSLSATPGTGAYSNGDESLLGSVLFTSRLTAPFDSLDLVYTLSRLPPGPGAYVLGWVSLVLAVVFLGGFFALYRLGLGQINLARQQQDFVSAVSHELKTPLTSIRMYGEMLKEGWADEAKRQSYYEFIHDESERLTRLISNVLQLARITRNEPQFDQKPVQVGELMSQVESKIASQVERAGFALEFTRDSDAATLNIDIDADCFAQIIINLVDNAIKFSKDADCKRIEITCRSLERRNVRFAVRDYGPGIPKDQLKKIFTLFYRSESELTRETVGTGIGLAIVHQLTQAMAGTVDVTNKAPGVEFSVTFPVV